MNLQINPEWTPNESRMNPEWTPNEPQTFVVCYTLSNKSLRITELWIILRLFETNQTIEKHFLSSHFFSILLSCARDPRPLQMNPKTLSNSKSSSNFTKFLTFSPSPCLTLCTLHFNTIQHRLLVVPGYISRVIVAHFIPWVWQMIGFTCCENRSNPFQWFRRWAAWVLRRG